MTVLQCTPSNPAYPPGEVHKYRIVVHSYRHTSCFQHGKNGVNVTRADQMVRTVAARESEQENAGTAAGKRVLPISQWKNARMNVEKIVALIMPARTSAT